MPIVTCSIDDETVFARFDHMGPRVREMLVEALTPIADAMLADARGRAEAHIHSTGAKPGLYLDSIQGGVADKPGEVVGWVRSANPLAHLLEYGFTISDMTIEASAGAVMKFEMPGAGELYRREVHRHEIRVRPYPAIRPALDDFAAAIEAAFENVKYRIGRIG
jgi:hypothetical protein